MFSHYKTFVAKTAVLVFNPHVEFCVDFQIFVVEKEFFANFAFHVFLSRVVDSVLSEGTTTCIGFETERAFERLNPLVAEFVHLE